MLAARVVFHSLLFLCSFTFVPALCSQTPRTANEPASANSSLPPDEPQPLPGPRPSNATIRQWQDRKFGMFIHFGLYSAYGGMVNGKKIDNGYSEQIMANAPIPLKEYAASAAKFNPTNFDPDAIVALAKSAGMKFIVITAKHHDGFNMFHTAQTNYNIVDATPYRKDVIKLMEEACARGGMKFGVYYSSIDWHYPGASSYIEGNSNPIPPAHEAFNIAQLKELASNYGPLSEIWFDMGKPTPEQSERFTRTVHDLQPQTMVSGRVFNYQGDFTVMGDNEVPDFVIDEPWQTPASIFSDTWGYRSWQERTDITGKIEENILRLVQVVSRGGNFILNIGPKGDGSIVPYERDVLLGIGSWMTIRGDAIYGTSPQPFRHLDFGYATTKTDNLYLFLKDVHRVGELHLPGVKTRLKNAYVMGDPQSASLPIVQDGSGAVIRTGPLEAALKRMEAASGTSAAVLPVIVVKFDAPLLVQPETIGPQPDGRIVLKASQADHFMNYNGRGYEAPATLYKLRWNIAAKAGNYRIALTYRPRLEAEQLCVMVDGKSSLTWVDAQGKTDDSGGSQVVELPGSVRIAGGSFSTIEITPPQPFFKGTSLQADIEQLTLSPVSEGH
ncbi:MAG TPA: alpha-L-fucosidase [Terracidiphilus sp.]